jgi:archaemetzincin
MKAFVWLVILSAAAGAIAMNFVPPTQEEALNAIGNTSGVGALLRRALDPGTDFTPMPAPERGDWLAEHPEAGQTFDEFLRTRIHRPDGVRNKIYLQPLGLFQGDRSPSLRTLKSYAAAYFAMDVEALPPINLTGLHLTTRINPFTRNTQILTRDIMALLEKGLAGDAFCLLGITMEDLYPDPSWNFVFGQASLRDRVGVFSFARYDPAFYGEREEHHERLLLRRSCKVLAHEIGHMFSMQHCIFFECAMNGSNHLRESDERPMALCPVCLRKLQSSIGFDLVDRYRRLYALYHDLGFEHEASWVRNRLKRIVRDENSG